MKATFGAGCFWGGVSFGVSTGGVILVATSFRIVTVADPPAIVPPPVGLERVTVKSRFGSTTSFDRIGIVIVFAVVPGVKVSVPFVAV